MDNNIFRTARGYQLAEKSVNELSPSLEDYLEMVCRSIRDNGFVRITDLSKALNVKASSASKMIGKLADLKFIDYHKYGIIKLTEKGRHTGEYLLWRHKVICEFFSMIGAGDAAFEECEKAEHILSSQTVENMEHMMQFFKANKECYKLFTGYISRSRQ